MSVFWHENWNQVRDRMNKWWEGTGLVLCVTAPRSTPLEDIPLPSRPDTIERMWLDPVYRARKAEYELSCTYFGAESFPYFDTQIGPGNLATFLGSEPGFSEDTVWFSQCIDASVREPLEFCPEHKSFKQQIAIIEEGLELSRGRFLVGMPDLVENIDILASLRGTNDLLMDMVERPRFVKEKIAEINQAYFTCFDIIYERIQDEWGGNAFSAFRIWGPGKTAKVQCDTSAMFSPTMFEEYVVPALEEQCEWLDYSMFHLDGTQCLVHLDALLDIESLKSIEWTPQSGMPQGGDPMWYDLYHKILRSGKSVQIIGVEPTQVIPILEELGPAGVFIMTYATDETQAHRLIEATEKYR